MIIIFWKSFPYFPSALQSCGLFVVPDGWWPQSELVNWLNWAQLGWVLLSSSFPTEWALCVPWASDLKNEHCMNPLGANNSSSGTSGAMSPLPCRVRALHKYRIQNIWEFSPGKHPLCWAVNSSLSAWALCSQVNTVRGCFISHREISLQQNPVQSSRRCCCRGGELCSLGLQQHQSPKVLGGEKPNEENLCSTSEQTRTARWQSSSGGFSVCLGLPPFDPSWELLWNENLGDRAGAASLRTCPRRSQSQD